MFLKNKIKINKIDKAVTSLINTKRKVQIAIIRNEWGDITTDPIDSKKISEYYEQPYVNSFNNLDEMDKFFEGHLLSKMTQEEKENLNSPITVKEN